MNIVVPAQSHGAATHGRTAVTVDRVLDEPRTGVFDADGRVTIESEVVPSGQVWEVERIIVGTLVGSPEARVYVGGTTDVYLVDGTQTGRLDVSEYPAGLIIPQGARLYIRWDYGVPDTLAWMRLQIHRIRWVDVQVGG